MDIDQISFGIKASAGKASTSLDRLVQSLDKLNDAFARVQTSGTGAITTLNGIVSASSGIKTGLKGASASAKTTSTAMKQVTTTTGQTSNVLNTMRARLKTVSSAMVGVHRDTKTATSGMSRLIQKITQITFVVYVARRALRAFGQGIQASIDYVENLNLFMVALGDNTSRATGFIKEMSESLYLDEAQLTRVQGLFYQISEALGLSSDKAYTLSENFTKLAYDLASFYNITIEDAVVKLQAGLVGETEPLRRIGIIITENNLAETARNLGIKKSIRNMTEMEKIQLRYVTALQQTQNAHGDMARTLEQPENLLRILKEQFQVLMRELGNVAIPIIQKLIPQVIGLTMALAELARQMAKTLGYEAPEIRDDLGGFAKTVADETKNMEKSTDNTQKNWAKILKYTRDSASAMTGIDELNVLSDDEGGFAGMSVDDLFPSADETRDQIDLGIEDYNNNMEASKGLFGDIIQQWKDLFTEIGNVFETTKTAVNGLWEEVFGDIGSKDNDKLAGLRIMNEIITGIVTGVTDMVTFFKELYNDALKPIFELIAPDWIKGLQEGTGGELAKTVAFLTKAFVVWKAIEISASLLGLFGKIITVGGLIGGKTGLLALLGAVAGLKIGLDIHEATVDGDWEALEDKILDAVVFGLAGLGAGLVTGSAGVATLVFSIPVLFNFSVKGLWEKSSDFWKNIFGPTAEDILDGQLAEIGFDPASAPTFTPPPALTYAPSLSAAVPSLPSATTAGAPGLPSATSAPTSASNINRRVGLMQKIAIDESDPLWWRSNNYEKGYAKILEYIKDIDNAMKILDNIGTQTPNPDNIWDAYVSVTGDTTIKKGLFANGGVPEKGNLFVAGEKGPELVTEHNGETVVMNEQQLKDRGVSFYADGVNIPPKGYTKVIDGEAKKKEAKKKEVKPALPINEKMMEGLRKSFDSLTKAVDTFNTISLGGEVTEPLDELSDTSPFDIVNDFNKATDKVKDKLLDFGDKFNSVTSIVNTTYDGFKKLAKFGVGALLNAFNKFADSKSFQTLFKGAPAEGGTTKQQQKAMGDVIGATLGDGPAGQIFGLAQSIADGTVGKFLESAPMMIDAGMDFLMNLLDGVVKALPAILQALPEVIRKMVDVLSNPETIKTIIQAMISVVGAIVVALPDIFSALVMAIPTVISALIGALMDFVMDGETWVMLAKIGANLAIGIMEGLANIVVAAMNVIISIAEIPVRWLGISFPRVPEVDLSGLMFAEGGFPQQGQMFIAREAGAELVGNIGGSTAVANNDQIVTAVSDGVYRAVSQAMSERGGQRVSLRVDGRRMSEAMDLASKKRGLAFGTGGY
jgi:hypothetical protein